MATEYKVKWLWFICLVQLVIISNTIIYQFVAFNRIDSGIVIGSFFDFFITIPALTYFFIIRKRYSLKHLIPVIVLSLALAHIIIPTSLVPTNLFLFIGVVLAVIELYFISKFVCVLFVILRKLKKESVPTATFQYRLERVSHSVVSPSRIRDIIFTEMTMLYYSLFSYRKKMMKENMENKIFTIHQKTSIVAFYIMIIHALIIETIGLHFLIHAYSPQIAIVLFLVNFYTLLFLLAQIQAIRLCPVIMSKTHLFIHVGFMKQLNVPYSNIQYIRFLDKEGKLSNVKKTEVLDAVLADFSKESPLIEIGFLNTVEVKLLYGFKKIVTKVHITPDDSLEFYDSLQSYILK